LGLAWLANEFMSQGPICPIGWGILNLIDLWNPAGFAALNAPALD
jgi:hypothetical protein